MRPAERRMERVFAGLARLASRTAPPAQVAAVCYRWSESSVEFLLVRTSAGKWTFPKGRLNPSMSASESAAREAREEAGARGRIAERHFGSYLDSKRALGDDPRSREVRIVTYLLEVHSTMTPEESDRYPTWYGAREAKRRLAEGRPSVYAKLLAKVVDSALEHVTKSPTRRSTILARSQGRRLVQAR